MNCDKCGSERVAQIAAKCDDRFSCGMVNEIKQYDGYVPIDMGITHDPDYVVLKYCMACGKIQGKFPLPQTSLEMERDNEDSNE